MVIAYVGYERADIPFFLTQIASVGLNKKTLLVDNSKIGDLFRARTNNGEQVREIGNLTLVRNLCVSEKEVMEYEVIVLYHGLSVFDKEYELLPDALYVSTTMNTLLIDDTKKALLSTGFMKQKINNISIVLEDEVAKKFSLQQIALDLGVIPSNGFVLPLDEKDHLRYEMLCNNGSISLKGASEDMADLIKDAQKNLFGLDQKSIKRVNARV